MEQILLHMDILVLTYQICVVTGCRLEDKSVADWEIKCL